MQVNGVIKLIRDTNVISDKFKKREFVVVTPSPYPQEIVMQFTQAKTEILDKYSEGQEVTVDINIRGREHKGNYYVTLEAWKITANSEGTQNQETDDYSPVVDDDLPF